jgi:acetyltransferase
MNLAEPVARPWRPARVAGYPAHLIEHGFLATGQALTIRPIKPQDERLELDFLERLSPQSRYQRLLSPRKLLPGELHRLTHIDYHHEMALVALLGTAQQRRMVGVARYVLDADGEACDFAIVLADELQGQGLGRRLLSSLLDAADKAGVLRMEGITLASNSAMLRLARKLGFQILPEPGDNSVSRLRLEVAQRRDGWFDL